MNTRPRSSNLSTFALLAFPILLAGCGDDDPAGPSDDLTDAEVRSLVDALISSSTVVDIEATVSARLAAVTTSGSVVFPIDETLDCVLGGDIRVVGEVTVEYDDASETGTYEHDLVQTHRDCRVRPEGASADFLLDGDPTITSNVDIELEDGSITDFDGTETGTLVWQYSGRSGRCSVALAYVISPTLPADPSYHVTGTLCGRAVDRVVPIVD